MDRRLRGEKIPAKPRKVAAKLIDDMDYKDIAKKLGGISRQRVFQLKNKGALRARLDGVDGVCLWRESMEKVWEEKRHKYVEILAQRKPGESISQLAIRFNVAHGSLRKVAGNRVPFGEERRLERARQMLAKSEKAMEERKKRSLASIKEAQKALERKSEKQQ